MVLPPRYAPWAVPFKNGEIMSKFDTVRNESRFWEIFTVKVSMDFDKVIHQLQQKTLHSQHLILIELLAIGDNIYMNKQQT